VFAEGTVQRCEANVAPQPSPGMATTSVSPSSASAPVVEVDVVQLPRLWSP
jgi:hypothetical protein